MLPKIKTKPKVSLHDLTALVYGPSKIGKCLKGDTILYDPTTGCPVTLKEVVEKQLDIMTLKDAGVIQQQTPSAFIENEPAQLFRLTTQTGRSIEATANHPFLTRNGWKPLEELFSNIDSRPLTVAEMGEAVLSYYHPILKRKYDDHPKRMKDLEQLLTIMERYCNLEGFLIDMALEPPNTSVGDRMSTGQHDDERLVLSTIHSAKGLEWHTVIIIWALDGRFPSVHALNSQEELEEELRLMYVAATRAKENLFITYPGQVYDRASGMFFGRPSRFVDQLPDSVLERHTVDLW